MVNSNSKGDRNERQLVNELDGQGFAVIRAPASGSATARELPDVLAGDGDTFLAIETKSSSGDPIYYDEGEVEDLMYFAENFGAEPRLGARFDGDGNHYLFHPLNVYRTGRGNYRIKNETAEEKGQPHREI